MYKQMSVSPIFGKYAQFYVMPDVWDMWGLKEKEPQTWPSQMC